MPLPPTSARPVLPALDLRCRDAEWVDRAQTLREFAGLSKSSRAHRSAGLVELLLADVAAREHFGLETLARERPVLSCELPRRGIPTAPWDPTRPLIQDWRIQAELASELLPFEQVSQVSQVSQVGRDSSPVRRVLIAAAGALPLLLSPAFAQAAPPETAAAMTTGATATPPSLPSDPNPAPAPTPGPATGPTIAPSITPGEAGTPAAPPPPRVDDDLALTGTRLWAGLIDSPVSLTMRSGQSLAGVLVAQSAGELAIARSDDGNLVSVPKAEIAGVRVQLSALADRGTPMGVGPIAERPTRDGRGLYGGGIGLVTTGAILTLAGAVMFSNYPSGLHISMPLLIPGLLGLAGGSTMIVFGKKRRTAFRAAWGLPNRGRLQVTPTFGAGRDGGRAGLVLRF